MRYHGVVGYGVSQETPPDSGIWKDVITEFPYTGNVVRNSKMNEEGTGVNKNIVVGNTISILADQYAIEHFFQIKYVEWMGALWTVTKVVVERPRLILSLGEVYNGPTP